MTAPDLDVLESLLAKATPGPWARERGSIYVAHEGDDHRAGTLFTGACNKEWNRANSALIVAAVNALPALLAYVRELERERDKALRKLLSPAQESAYLRIVIAIAESMLDDPNYEWSPTDFEYESRIHDKIRALHKKQDAALAMREKCAKACEALKVNRPSDPLANAFDGACETCSAAIRALEP